MVIIGHLVASYDNETYDVEILRYRQSMAPDDDMTEIELDEETAAMLDDAAAKTGKSTDSILVQALRAWVAKNSTPEN